MRFRQNHRSTQSVDGINIQMEYIVVVAILLVGFYLRLAMVSEIQIDTPFRADARQYTAYAYNLSKHRVYSLDFNGLIDKQHIAPSPDALRTPGYPLFLFLFTGSKNLDQFAVNVFYFQAILSAITIAVVYVLGRTLLSVLGAAIAAALTAISPHLINLNIYLLTETLFTFVLVLTIGALILSGRYENRYLWIASGILLAVATLIKPTIQYYFLFFIGFVLLGRESPECKKISILFIAASFLCIFSTWLFRNLVSLGYLSDPAITINTLHHGMYPHFMYNGQASTFGFPYRFDPHSQEISSSLSSVLVTIAHRFYTQPLTHLVWYLSKPSYLFRWEMIQGIGTFIYPVSHSPYESSWLFMRIYSLMRVIHPIVVFLSMAGMVFAWLPDRMFTMTVRQRFAGRLISLTYFYFILVHIAAAPFPRYSIPIRPFTYVLAWLGISLAATMMKKKLARMRNARLTIKELR
ncbi:conserved membrane hypothetical protein [Desulfosarcina cetonica]|nr:conserved membrane hypothetical protein [Desulfosarcina cetonica]